MPDNAMAATVGAWAAGRLPWLPSNSPQASRPCKRACRSSSCQRGMCRPQSRSVHSPAQHSGSTCADCALSSLRSAERKLRILRALSRLHWYIPAWHLLKPTNNQHIMAGHW
jgi:hypothetical protein